MKIISGREKGRTGEISQVFRHNSSVVVKDINLKTKHVKSRGEDEPGQIIKVVFTALLFNLYIFFHLIVKHQLGRFMCHECK